MTRHVTKLDLATGIPLNLTQEQEEVEFVEEGFPAVAEHWERATDSADSADSAAGEDRDSSASRQHYIDTGRYLQPGEAWTTNQVLITYPGVVSRTEPADDSDPVEHPNHYTRINGLECIEVTRHFNFCLGNAIKYIWRAGHKGDAVQDLRKAIQYLEFEIDRLGAA